MKQWLALVLISFAFGAYGDGGTFGKGPSAQTSSYGALAYDAKTHAWAYAIKVPEKARATAIVSKLCGQDCAVLGPFDACGVVVSKGTGVAYGEGPDRAAAESSAQAKCTWGTCEVAVWGCNSLASAEGFSYHHDGEHPKNFGAIAYDKNSGAFGSVWDQPSLADAVAVAKGDCGKECRIYLIQAGDCGVLAKGDGSIATGSGIDYKAAEGVALAKCGSSTCKTLSSFCNSKPK